METLKAVIVDDEPLAREYLRSLLDMEPGIKVIAECADGLSAVQAIERLRPDIVFLDVQMPGLDGFGVIDKIGAALMPAVIFVTAFDRYAIRAFESHALDYLLKPFDGARLRKAVEHAGSKMHRHESAAVLSSSLAQLLESILQERGGTSVTASPENNQSITRLPIKTPERSYLLSVVDIDWVEAADYCVILHSQGKKHLLRQTMKSLEPRLPKGSFFRVHRGALVNLDHIKELRPGSGGDFIIILRDGSQLPLTRRRRRELEAFLGGPI